MAEQTKSMAERPSAFKPLGLPKTIQQFAGEIRELYLGDAVPWVIGYSGGKDSSAVLQLVWNALRDLPDEQRKKPVHVISTDTLVEQPLVSSWVDASLARMRSAAAEQGLPIVPHKLTPEVEDSFWVNIIGKRLPGPAAEVSLVHRSAQDPPVEQVHSRRRPPERRGDPSPRHPQGGKPAAGMSMAKHEARRVRDRLSPNANLPKSLVYTPIEDWSNDDVWLYLMQVKNPWGHDNKTLLGMYQGASEGGECPLVVDTTTPSCGPAGSAAGSARWSRKTGRWRR